MFSFIISLICLVLGYLIYGKIVDRIFGPDPSRETPARQMRDDIDFVPMKTRKVFMIQFLNIAGTGPIFGAIMGIMFGPSCFIWIVLGSIFAGGVHDYMSGMMSIRSRGANIPVIAGNCFGKVARRLVLIFTLIMLLIVGPVFIYSPALILSNISIVFPIQHNALIFFTVLIFVYYIASTIFPIDKIVGKIYPVFAFLMLFMAVALLFCLFVKWPQIPEFWDGLQNRGPSLGREGQPIFPGLFITVACGAISGFHSTQSPMMARCLRNEKYGRNIFYGAMIAEGAVALIWAAVTAWFFYDGGMQEIGSTSIQAPNIVADISKAWLGTLGGLLAIAGVVIAPITSGDTCFRSARLIVADAIHLSQKKIFNRLVIALPLFALGFAVLMFNYKDSDGFNILWRYFGLSNQLLASLVLWCASVYLCKEKGNYSFLISFIPACFMTCVCASFFAVDKTCLGLSVSLIPWICWAIGAGCVAIFFILCQKYLWKREENAAS